MDWLMLEVNNQKGRYIWSNALSIAALDFINAGRNNGFDSVEETAKSLYTHSLGSVYTTIISHDKNSGWPSNYSYVILGNYIKSGYFKVIDVYNYTHLGVACSCHPTLIVQCAFLFANSVIGK